MHLVAEHEKFVRYFGVRLRRHMRLHSYKHNGPTMRLNTNAVMVSQFCGNANEEVDSDVSACCINLLCAIDTEN